jgi:hypothetical protein
VWIECNSVPRTAGVPDLTGPRSPVAPIYLVERAAMSNAATSGIADRVERRYLYEPAGNVTALG